MILASVLGNIVATQKNERYESARVMLCEQITPEGDATGTTILALDSVDAGVGDTVLIVQEGWGASTAATGKPGAAIDSAIVGVVDRIDFFESDFQSVISKPAESQTEVCLQSMSTELDQARSIAERIARKVSAGGSPNPGYSSLTLP